MKRLAFTLSVLLMLTACDGNATQPSCSPDPTDNSYESATPSVMPSDIAAINLEEYDDYFDYPNVASNINDANSVKTFMTSFAVDEGGILYRAYSIIRPDGMYDYQISACDLNGEVTKIYDDPQLKQLMPSHMCAGDGYLYFRGSVEENGGLKHQVYGLNLLTQEIKRMDVPLDMFSSPGTITNGEFVVETDAILKIAYLDGKLYIMGTMDDYMTEEYDRWIPAPGATGGGSYQYQYDGRILAVYDIKSETFEIVFNGMIQNFSPTPNGTVMLYAYDPPKADETRGMFYFSELYPKTMSLGDRIYWDLRQWHTYDFAADGHGIMYTGTGQEIGTNGSLYYRNLEEKGGTVEIKKNPGVLSMLNTVVYSNGFTFFRVKNDESGDIEQTIIRFRNSSIEIGTPIQVIGAGIADIIPREGHNIRYDSLTDDEFSLSVLAGGGAYDIAFAETWQNFAYNMRDKGSFYPLNDVPGVMEYLDACFPYIKEAATDENGDIWMLPIDINIEAIVYHEENSLAAGLDFANAKSAEDIVREVMKGVEYDPANPEYIFVPNRLLRKSLDQYLRDNNTLDTPEFRSLAPMLKELIRVNDQVEWGRVLPFYTQDEKGNSVWNPRFLFDNLSDQRASLLTERDDLLIVPITGTGAPSSADAAFLCVNPNTANLEEALSYVSQLAQSLLEQKDVGLLSDASAYTGSAYAQRRHALYANATIDFNLSDEVFADVFDRYLNDEISLDEMIQEADRKLAMYRGE